MLKKSIRWRVIFSLLAIIIVIGSMFYTHYLSSKLGMVETQRMHNWVEAHRTIANSTNDANLNLAIAIATENTDIPIIETNEHDSITSNYFNLDTIAIRQDSNYLSKKLQSFKKLHPPIVLELNKEPSIVNKYYYGETLLQRELRYFPIVQLLIIAFFIGFIVIALKSESKSAQNRLWVGMAKETAHQLGTPITSLAGWTEILKAYPVNNDVLPEVEKDIERLKLISDRFAKIGSIPKLELHNITVQVANMVAYIKKRAAGNIVFEVQADNEALYAKISPPLFDWVIENLLKNALDAMEGKGKIVVRIKQLEAQIFIDISDTGKGISFTNQKKVFDAGYTTKARGWGLGLALTKRIVCEYHKGNIYVKSSEIDKGTTFRIVLDV